MLRSLGVANGQIGQGYVVGVPFRMRHLSPPQTEEGRAPTYGSKHVTQAASLVIPSEELQCESHAFSMVSERSPDWNANLGCCRLDDLRNSHNVGSAVAVRVRAIERRKKEASVPVR